MARIFSLVALAVGIFSVFAQAASAAPKELNNLVSELLVVDKLPNSAADLAFDNPRAGWVFISLSSSAPDAKGNPNSSAFLDDKQEPLVWRHYPPSNAMESMQYLKSGSHKLHIKNVKDLRLDVRAIPELMYCYYPTSPHIAAYGPYDWNFMKQHILPHVNVLVTRSDIPRSEFDEWLREGRHWVSNDSLPGLGDKKAPEPATVLAAWAKNKGVVDPGFSGMIVDEFGDFPAEHFASWTEALKKLHAMPQFAGKTYYAWCGNLAAHKPSWPLCKALLEFGDLFTWEVYQDEQPTLEAVQKKVLQPWIKETNQWKEAFPNIMQKMVMCPGYLSAPPETLNLNPQVDYQVFMDMQFHELATNPVFRGLYGIMEYMADYADEESLRYAHLLFRHYAIEGKTERFNNDPYVLPHLKNGDFANGLNEWTVEAAAPDSIKADSMKDLGWLEGRYPQKVIGDKFCRLTRNGKKQNVLKQTLQSLQSGRLYSIKYIAADMKDLHANKAVTLNAKVKDAEVIDKYNIDFVYPSIYNHESGPYTKDNPAHFTWRRIVFKPTGTTAEFSISDWTSETAPGAPEAQEIGVNFIEVQPFHE